MKFFKLDNLCVMTLNGERVSDYLQGQVSCDIRQVSNTHIQQGALCNLQGRILALMDIINWDGYKLILAGDLVENTKKSLEKTALLSRVKLSIEPNISVFGLYYNQNSNMLANYPLPQNDLDLLAYEHFAIANLGANQYLMFIHNHHIKQVLASLPELSLENNLAIWHALRLQAGHCSIHAETRGSFLPHRLNLHKLAYLSFNKGCYRGQEVVARMHYRGTAKHELIIADIHRNASLKLGTRITDTDGQRDIGELIDYSPLGNNHIRIAASLLIERPATLYFEGENNPIEPSL